MKKKYISALIYFLLITFLAALVGNFFTAPSIPTWYASLNKPSFSPPNWLFGPAWTILYILMAVSAFWIWSSYAKARDEKEKRKIKTAIVIYGVHLVLNALWSFIFFGLQNPAWAFFEILILWVLIMIVAWKFYQIRRIAGIFFIPYILWVTFASVLNFAIWQLNI